MLGIKKRYWIISAILLVVGLIYYKFIYGYSFTGLLLCGGSVLTMVFGALNLVKRVIFKILFYSALVVGLVMAIFTGKEILTSSQGSEDPKADFVIVLGAGVDGTEPSISLQERILAAKNYALKYPDSVLILTGCQGEYEDISEAQCMYDRLVAEGLSPQRLILEEQAQNTEENIAFSLELIREAYGEEATESVCIISSEYHLYRAGLYASTHGIEAKLYPAETENRLYYLNMFLREICGIWKFRLG